MVYPFQKQWKDIKTDVYDNHILGTIYRFWLVTVCLSFTFYLLFLSACRIKGDVSKWETQEWGYYGDPNETLAAALIYLLIWVFFALCTQFSHQNVDLLFRIIPMSQVWASEKKVGICWNFQAVPALTPLKFISTILFYSILINFTLLQMWNTNNTSWAMLLRERTLHIFTKAGIPFFR